MRLTTITAKGLEDGLPFFRFTKCPKCEKVFADGIEGAPNNELCDQCWDKSRA